MPATLINGEPDEMIPVTDRGFHYGDGIFETIRITGRQPSLWPLHQQRLAAGCEFLKIPLQPGLLEQDIHQLLMANEPEGILKIVLSRGSGGRGYCPPERIAPLRIVQYYPLPENIDEARTQGVRVMICNHPLSSNQRLVRYKHLCRIDQVIASSELSETFAEGIMRTEDGQVVEGTRSNLFMAKGQVLITPDLNNAGIQGVMREYLLDRFAAQGIATKELKVELSDLLGATEVFLCNSVFGVWPITELVNGEIVKQFQIGQYTENARRFADEIFAV